MDHEQATTFISELTEGVCGDRIPIFFMRGNHEIRTNTHDNNISVRAANHLYVFYAACYCRPPDRQQSYARKRIFKYSPIRESILILLLIQKRPLIILPCQSKTLPDPGKGIVCKRSGTCFVNSPIPYLPPSNSIAGAKQACICVRSAISPSTYFCPLRRVLAL